MQVHDFFCPQAILKVNDSPPGPQPCWATSRLGDRCRRPYGLSPKRLYTSKIVHKHTRLTASCSRAISL